VYAFITKMRPGSGGPPISAFAGILFKNMIKTKEILAVMPTGIVHGTIHGKDDV
jgi:hypothetical protein